MAGKPIKINLGCGEKHMEGYINCDVLSNVNAEKVFDLNRFPYPFKDNFADEIFLDNVLEHLGDIVHVMQEIYRILHDGGIVKILVPYGKSDWAIQDPTHLHFFNEKSMDYFIEDYRYNYYTKIRFKKIKTQLYTSSETSLSRLRNFIPFRSVLKNFFFNMYDGVYFELAAVK